MSWATSLLDASFRGVTFDVIDIDDTVGHAVSVFEYPYVDGGEAEDLGTRPATFALNAIFFGDDYEARLRKLLDALKERGPGELIHPVWGSIPRAQVQDFSVRHGAEAPDSATVRMAFVETAEARSFWDGQQATQRAAAVAVPGDKATAASGEKTVSALAKLRAANLLAPLDAARAALLGPLLAGVAEAKGVVVSGLDVVNYPRAWLADIGTVTNTILGARAWQDTLQADFRGLQLSLGRAFGVKPSRTGTKLAANATPTEAQAVAVTALHVSVTSATTLANGAGLLLASEASAATLSPPEIEAVANTARAALLDAMDDARAVLDVEGARAIVEPLRDQALAVQQAAAAIIEARPPLIDRPAPLRGNYRLIAHALYGDHSRATELARLNPRKANPNTIQAGEVIHAYAQ